MKKHAWLILCLITLVAGLALSLTNRVTEGPIAEQQLQARNAARLAVFPDANGFEEQTVAEGSKLDSLYSATQDGAIAGYVLQTTVKGYASPIEVVMGVNNDGVITGVTVGGTDFAETPGLGTLAREPAFTNQFVSLSAAPKLRSNIDAISGATITSSAVTAGANTLYTQWQVVMGLVDPNASVDEPLTSDNIKVVQAKGFAGDFEVSVGINADGTVEGVRIDEENFKETDGIGTQVLDKAFRDQFVGKSAPLSFGDGIDAIAGATVSSTAVLNAVNEALGSAPAAAPEAATDWQTLETADASGAVKVYTETVKGFAGDVEVKVGLNANDAITSLTVGGANFNETPDFGARAKDEAFTSQFIGKSGELKYDEGVDAIAGATITSDAVLSAINNATAGESAAPAAAPAAEPAAEAAAGAMEVLATPDASGAVKVYTETVKGFAGDIVVTVGLDANDAIVSLGVGGPNFNETEYYGAQAQTNAFRNQFIGKSGELKYGEGVDAIAGATITSDAVLSAVNNATAGESAAPAAEPAAEAAIGAQEVPDAPDASGAVKVYTETVKGFAGDVEVKVGLNANDAITSLTVGGANFNETPDFGAKAKDEAFTSQFIGKSGELKYGEGVDAIAGATITSDAVLSAVNNATAGESAAPAAEPAAEAAAGALEVLNAPDASGAVKVYTETVKGFAGDVEVKVGLDANDAITSLTVGGANFNETADFGAKAKDEAFTSQFIGKSGELKYGEGVDAIAGATITSDAVLGAINNATAGESASPAAEPAAEAAAGAMEVLDAPDADGAVKVYTETVKGFAGDVEVKVGLDANDAITSLTVGGANFNETADFGAKAKDEAFTSQFIGKSGELKYGEGVDAIAGATITSDAVLSAVNNATTGSAPANAVDVETLAAPDADGAVKICTSTVQGFAGEIVVKVGLDAQGAIVSLSIGGPNFKETEYYGAQAQTNAFRNQFIGKSGELKYGEGVDAIAGATITSDAVLSAINDSLKQ